jgi:site-specific recombinase XerD
VRRIVQAWCDLAGIGKSVHPHSLRHTFATSLLGKTGNLRLVQKALDHESPQTTAIYAHVVDGELQAAIERRG